MSKSSITNGAAGDRDVPTRDRILLVAARLFRYNGYDRTSLREIAKESHITVGSIYNHFTSKELILNEVLRIGVENVGIKVRDRVAALPDNVTWRERIEAAIHEHLLNALHQGDFTSANIRLWALLPSEGKRQQRAMRRKYVEYWRDLFSNAQAAGELKQEFNSKLMELFVLGAINWTVEWYDPRRGSFADLCDQLLAMIFDGIAVDPPDELKSMDE